MEDYFERTTEVYSLLSQLQSGQPQQQLVEEAQSVYNQISHAHLSVPQREEIKDLGKRLDEAWFELN